MANDKEGGGGEDDEVAMALAESFAFGKRATKLRGIF